MGILTILFVLIVFGVVLWAINTYVPMDGKFKKLVNVVAIIAIIYWLLKVSGWFNTISHIKL